MNALDKINLCGTVASLIGLVIVLYQIRQVKAISVASLDASEKTKARITSLLFAMDIPKALKIVQEIQYYNRGGKLELSILRTQDLKYHLLQIKNNERFTGIVDRRQYTDFIVDLSIEISNMEKEIRSKTKLLDIVKSNETLEKILNALSDMDIVLKAEGGLND